MENLTSQNLDFKGMKPVKQVKVCYLNISRIFPARLAGSSANLFNADFYDLNYPLKTLKIHLNLSMNITAVCPSPLAPLVLLSEMEIIERREHKFNCSETTEFLFIFVIGGESINMKLIQRGMRLCTEIYLDQKCDLDKNLDGRLGIMYLRV